MTERTNPDYYRRLRLGDGISLDTALKEGKVDFHLRSLDEVLVERYEKELIAATESEAPIIDLEILPVETREIRQRQLEIKFGEYTARYKRKLLNGHAEKSLLSTLYKREGLMLLLKFGRINTYAYSRSISVALNTLAFGRDKAEAMGHTSLSVSEFNNACATIGDYVHNGGENLRGGAGLPVV